MSYENIALLSLVKSIYDSDLFFDIENKIKPNPRMIRVTGQGSGSPSGLGLFKIINVESTIRSIPETAKQIFDIFSIETPFIF